MAKDAVKQTQQGITEIVRGKRNIKTKKAMKTLTKKELENQAKLSRMINAKQFLNGQAYDLERITIQIHEILDRVSLEFVRLGSFLLAVKEVEGHGYFIKWLSDNIPFSKRTAQYFMYVAAKIKERPELIPFTSGGVSKAVALLDLPEDYQEEFIKDGTIDGDDLDKYLTMSHKELREEVKRLKRPIDKVLSEETKALKKERDTAIAERDEYKNKLGAYEEQQQKEIEEVMRDTFNACLNFAQQAEKLMKDERINNRIIQGKLFGQIEIAESVLEDVRSELTHMVRPQEY